MPNPLDSKEYFGAQTIYDDLHRAQSKKTYEGTFETPKPQHIEASKVQIGGSHYKEMKIQPLEFILANSLGFCEGNAIKYLCRWRTKGGLEDLKKAKHYIDLLLESPFNGR